MTFSFVNRHPGVLLLNALQILSMLGVFKGEIDNPMPYSKFAMITAAEKKSNARVPSKIGMLIIYVPATIVAFVFQFLFPLIPSMSSAPTTAGWMAFVHFLKRDAEVLFVHKYSGDTELNTARIIGLSYAMNTLFICLLSNPDLSTSDICWKLGTLLFTVGSIRNFYHHSLLAQLRSNGNGKSQKKEYKAPRGGLFEYVAAPHYFFELVAWSGIAVASQQLTSYLIFGFMLLYLLARSQNQNNWNKKKFDEIDWPSTRKNLIPYVY